MVVPVFFRDFGTRSCFAVRYFDHSDDHKRLYKDIEDQAIDERGQKISELSQLRQKCQQMKDSLSQMEGSFYVRTYESGEQRSFHSRYCRKCEIRDAADLMVIKIHEWPLPSDVLQVKSVVFELKVPASFWSWQDATGFFINVLGIKHDS
ncbi:hypothetical protein N7491_006395 [Penicillium cf. griseofulvum]|uniref:Uncharacterized protein n=1 Tax=Penicillium cf. griseofulvum TaxID=2972120 RepID=A0A9W9M385_9EURO|nr:hypothetical protein N7472_010577 [Penicillium cf. griseofulvum]KAJ5429379.1 hypothetical protein N7491_006395 [Penicillium cf. griseofulvum]KAJ5436841.1 hypothetical protein N7445_007726 [Penicillium cf. griseofulvum]